MVTAQQRLVLRPTNLYGNAFIVDFPLDGESLLLRDIVPFTADVADTWYPVIQNERLELIAYNSYKDYTDRACELWWVIADANNIFNPFDLSDYVGSSLLIPDFNTKVAPLM